MNGRQRVLTAAECKQPDRVPVDFWAVSEVLDRLQAHWGLADYEAVRDEVGEDVRYFRGPGLEVDPDASTFTDHWGVVRTLKTVSGTRRDGTEWSWTYKHMVESPLAAAETVADIEKHPWPDPAQWDYSGVKAPCQAIRDKGLAVVFGGDRLDRTAQLKAGMYLRGMDRFVMDLALEPLFAECILEHVAAYYLDYNRRIFEAADGLIDVFFMGDDMGTQESLWVSVDMYRALFKERFTEFNELAHAHGIKTMYHTCGRVTALVAEFVDAGLDILQSLQPAAMGDEAARIKKEFGRHLCFQGGIDIQHVLPHGTPADVRKQVRDMAAMLGDGGGYIFGTAHNLLPDVPTENVLALVDAYHEFGPYA